MIGMVGNPCSVFLKGIITYAGIKPFWRDGAAIAIDGELLAGSIPRKQLKIVTGWLAFHEEEAYAAWNLAVKGEHFNKIPPMK